MAAPKGSVSKVEGRNTVIKSEWKWLSWCRLFSYAGHPPLFSPPFYDSSAKSERDKGHDALPPEILGDAPIDIKIDSFLTISVGMTASPFKSRRKKEVKDIGEKF